MVDREPWAWLLAVNHRFWDVDGLPTFHAHDENGQVACERGFGLIQTTEWPNEGSHLCPDCMVVVRSLPRGRVFTDAE